MNAEPKRRKPRYKNLKDQRFERLTVVAFAGVDPKYGVARWLCECDCGRQRVVAGASLRAHATKSCGCYRADRLRATWAERRAQA